MAETFHQKLKQLTDKELRSLHTDIMNKIAELERQVRWIKKEKYTRKQKGKVDVK